jgi:flagellar biosynthesis regulator FlbT
MFSSNFEMFNAAMMKLEILDKLCCLQKIVVLPSMKLFTGLQTTRKHFQCEFRKMNLMFLAHPNKVHNSYMSCYHYASMNIVCLSR